MKYFRVKLFALLMSFLAPVLLVGCAEEYDDSKVWESINSLERRISAMETVLNAYKNKLFVESVAQVADGYIITFSDGSKASVYNGKDGTDGSNGETLISDVSVTDSTVTFKLTDGRSLTFGRHAALSITLETSSSVPVKPNSEITIKYTVTSDLNTINVETVTSADLKATVRPSSDGFSGDIVIKTSSQVDEFSKVLVLVSNGERMIMKKITFEQSSIIIKDASSYSVPKSGGQIELSYLSNVQCQTNIPESAKSWITIVPATKVMIPGSVVLKIEPNPGALRTAVITVSDIEGDLPIQYTVSQEGSIVVIDPASIPADEIWYTDSNAAGLLPMSGNVVSHIIEGGIGKIKYSSPLKSVDITFFNGDNPNTSLTGLYLPDNVEVIANITTYVEVDMKKFHIPASLRSINHWAVDIFKYVDSLEGSHVSTDGHCLIVGNQLRAVVTPLMDEYSLPFVSAEIEGVSLEGCKSRCVIIPEGVTHLADVAISYHGDIIEELRFPSSLQSIGKNSVTGQYERFSGSKFVTSDGLALVADNYLDSGLRVMIAYANGSQTSEYVIPEGVNMLYDDCFFNAKNLKRIILPSSIQRITSSAFTNMLLEGFGGSHVASDGRSVVLGNKLCYVAGKGLSSYTTPNGVKVLGASCMSGFDLVKEITIGDSVTDAEDYAIYSSTLEKLNISGRMNSLGTDPFSSINTPKLKEVYCKAPLSPKVSFNSYSLDFTDMTIYVPEQYLTFYKRDKNWKSLAKYMKPHDFGNLSEYYPDYYISSDFSKDGTFEIMQKATTGKGIDVVMMGDAYSDRLISDGTYKAAMQRSFNAFFESEPYRTFKSMFNVYYVNVVSLTESFEYSKTALECEFGQGTYVTGNHDICIDYARKALPANVDMDNVMIIVAMNSDAYAGTCHIYDPADKSKDYGCGLSLSYFPRGYYESDFEEILKHEACGHGFAKLADEYYYTGTMTSSMVSAERERESWGWWRNVDFTSNPSQVKWSTFLNDDRYKNEGLGVYEGAFTYAYGAYRPTEQSVMNTSGEFNAPSREAIYYRLHKLAYGDSWTYSYEDFVKYDEINRNKASSAKTRGDYVRKQTPHSGPVLVGRSWNGK